MKTKKWITQIKLIAFKFQLQRASVMIFYFVLLTISFNALSQNEVIQTFKNRQYVFANNTWNIYDLSSGTFLPIINEEIKIKFKAETTTIQKSNLIESDSLELLSSNKLGYSRYKLKPHSDIFSIANSIDQSNLADEVIISTIAKPCYMPNDPGAAMSGSQWYLDAIKMYQAWNKTKGCSNITIAVLDDGIDLEHHDIGNGVDGYSNVWINSDEFSGSANTDDGPNGYIDDLNGYNFVDNTPLLYSSEAHGTSTSGLIGAKMNNNEGIAGVCGGEGTANTGCKIMMCKLGCYTPPSSVINNDEDGTPEVDLPPCYFKGSIIDDAILYAVDNGAAIINMSFIANTNTQDINDAISYAKDHGVLMIAAAGNNSFSGQVVYPASSKDVMAISASDYSDNFATFSSYGDEIDIIAPGSDIYTTKDFITGGPQAGSHYWSIYGTSFSAPIVCGIAALCKCINPCLSPTLLKDILINTSDQVNGTNYNYYSNPTRPGHNDLMGYGRVNAEKAVNAAEDMNTANSTIDLYMKDQLYDFGKEPNNLPISTPMFESPDIWVRNQQDGITNQFSENPNYGLGAGPAYVYVRVRNKSCENSNANFVLKTYWTKANTATPWPTTWNGSTSNPLMGNIVGSQNIPIINKGEETILVFTWNTVPNPDDYNGITTEPWHFCILARIESIDDPMYVTEGIDVGLNIFNNNNIALRNIQVVKVNPFDIHSNHIVSAIGNLYDTPKQYSFTFTDNHNHNHILDETEIYFTLSSSIWEEWMSGGQLGNNVQIINENDHTIRIIGFPASIDNVILEGNETGLLTLKYNFLRDLVTGEDFYQMQMYQIKTDEGRPVNGEDFMIMRNERPIFYADAGSDLIVDKNDEVNITANTIAEPVYYNWYNSLGERISNSKILTKVMEQSDNFKLEITTVADGYKAYDEVNVVVRDQRLLQINPNPTSSNITVNYKITGAGNSSLLIVCPLTNIQNSILLTPNTISKTVDLSNYPIGVYNIILVCDGNFKDVLNVQKN